MIAMELSPCDVVGKAEPDEPQRSPKSVHSDRSGTSIDNEPSRVPSPSQSQEIRVTDSPIKEEPGSPIAASMGSPSLPSPPNVIHTPIASPALPTPPPMLFQPFLPSPTSSKFQLPSPNRPLPFSIDNILKPTFGQQLLLHNIATVAAAAQHQRARQFDISSNYTSHLGVKNEPSSSYPPLVSPPQRPKIRASSNNNDIHRNSSSRQSQQPVDLSSTKSKCSGTELATPKSEDTPSKDADCPPGMVRGPNGQLWPAWVFCTRYSDRPSSGEL